MSNGEKTIPLHEAATEDVIRLGELLGVSRETDEQYRTRVSKALQLADSERQLFTGYSPGDMTRARLGALGVGILVGASLVFGAWGWLG